MENPSLKAFWIVPPFRNGQLGFGVTAFSLDDALSIVRAMGFSDYLPNDLDELLIRQGVTVSDLDQSHVVVNMGPIIVRGMWYPFTSVGVPKWADERIQ